MPKGPQPSMSSEAEQTHSAEGNQFYRVLQEVMNFPGATVLPDKRNMCTVVSATFAFRSPKLI